MNSIPPAVPNEESVVAQHPIVRLVHMIIARFLQTTWWQQIFMLAIGAVIYICLAGWLGSTLVPPLRGWGAGLSLLPDIVPNNVPWLFVRWDAGYYWEVVIEGYQPNSATRAFFPLYPLVTRALNTILGLSVAWSGTLVSFFSFLATGIIMYKWVRIDYDHKQAVWTSLFLYLFPVAFYFVAFYADSLFLMLGILSIYLDRKGQFSASGIVILLAAVTRPHGIFLVIPYVIEFWQQHDFRHMRWVQFFFGLLIAPMGLLAYSIFLAQLGNGNLTDPYLDLLEQEWKTYLTWPWVSLIDALNSALFATNIQQDWFSRAYVIHDTFYAISGLILSVWAFFRLRLGVAAYLFISMMFFYSAHGPDGYVFESMPRHVANLPPIYLAIALLLNQVPAKLRGIILGLSVLLLGVLAAWFASGRWVA